MLKIQFAIYLITYSLLQFFISFYQVSLFFIPHMKRYSRFEPKEIRETRTLLITNIAIDTDTQIIKEKLETFGPIKETYTIADQKSILFAMFYDLRHAKQAKANLNNKRIGESTVKLYYTISKYEIPREGDICDETKNQGTVLMVCRDLYTPMTEEEIINVFKLYGDVKEVREYKAYQKFVEFYDSRCAVKCFDNFGEKKYKTGTLMVRLLWDTNTKTRWDIIRETDNVLQSLEKNDNKKMKFEKKVDVNKNVFMCAMDDFIVSNIDELVGSVTKEMS